MSVNTLDNSDTPPRARQRAASAEALLDRFASLAAGWPDLRGAVVVGSRVRTERPADEWSDLDLLLFTRTPERYLRTDDWLAPLGPYSISFLEGTVSGNAERRVLFDDGLDVDFNPIPVSRLRGLKRFLETGEGPDRLGHFADLAAYAFQRGIRVIVDKIGFADLVPLICAREVTVRTPAEADFLNTVRDFWYHAVWAARKLRRGELIVAKGCCDSYMKRLLIGMIEFHARASHGRDYDTWHDNRFLEQWADPRAVAGLRDAYATYDEESIRRALQSTMDLYAWLAREAAALQGWTYPEAAELAGRRWVADALGN